MPRIKKPLGTAIDPELRERVDTWISKQEFPPTLTAVLETALREFLERREGKKK